MTVNKEFDSIIIGFGKGGKTLASALAAAGKTVAMVEKSDQMYGGTCINTACIPTKFLYQNALLSAMQGGDFKEKASRYQKIILQKNHLIEKLRQKNFDKLDTNPNITVINAFASLKDNHTVLLQKGQETEEIIGGQIFLNTGARPFLPPISGLKESKRAFVSEQLLSLTELPEHLVIIGGGYIGVEFASIYKGFGSEVTVVQDGSVFLPREDEDISKAVLESLKERGIQIISSAVVQSIKDQETKTTVSVKLGAEIRELEADAILVATGRRPAIAGLGLENAGVAVTERGAVLTDEYLKTSAENIWAMGDVVGGLQFTYVSLDDYRIVKSQILGDHSRSINNRGAVPSSTFIDPPFSRVGLSEKEAKAQGYSIKIAKMPASAIPKSQVLGQATGLLKVIIDADTNCILGAHLFCAESHEMINLIKLVIDSKIPYMVLRDTIFTHPTMSESLNELLSAVQ